MLRPEVWFIPRYHADPDDYWTGLGVIAMIDAVRLTAAPDRTAMFLWILPLFFLFALMSNRLRDAGRSSFQSIPAIIGAVFAKSLAGLVGMAVAIMPFFESFIQTRETITGIRMTLEEAAQDQEVMDEFSNWLVRNADTVQPELFAASAWPSMIAFWIVIFAASQWYGKLPSRT